MRKRVIILGNHTSLEIEAVGDVIKLRVAQECVLRLTRPEAWEVAEVLDELATSAGEESKSEDSE